MFGLTFIFWYVSFVNKYRLNTTQLVLLMGVMYLIYNSRSRMLSKHFMIEDLSPPTVLFDWFIFLIRDQNQIHWWFSTRTVLHFTAHWRISMNSGCKTRQNRISQLSRSVLWLKPSEPCWRMLGSVNEWLLDVRIGPDRHRTIRLPCLREQIYHVASGRKWNEGCIGVIGVINVSCFYIWSCVVKQWGLTRSMRTMLMR